jgi:hypothetical protein
MDRLWTGRGLAITYRVHVTDKRSRAALAAVVAGCVAVTGVAVGGAGKAVPGLDFVQSGHLIYNSALGRVFHLDGATKKVDYAVDVPGAGPGAVVVQSDKSGYVLAQGNTIEFGKSDLAVADPVPVPGVDEIPVGLEAAGAAFAVYRQAGRVARLGERPVVQPVGGKLGEPVVTRDGTLWVHRTDTGQLCQLPLKADRVSCPAQVPTGHTGGLALVGDRLLFVDTIAKTMRSVGDDGLGDTAPLGNIDVTSSSVVATHDLGGRVAIVTPERNVLNLVDPAELTGDDPAQPPITKALGKGRYQRLASSGTVLALIDDDTDTVVTVDGEGEIRQTRQVPRATAKAKKGPAERARLFRGEDSRLYIDNPTGEHVMVVDDDGEVTEVRAEGDPGRKKPAADPTRPSQSKPGDKQNDKQDDGTDEEAGKQLGKPADKPSGRETDKPSDRPTGKPSDRETDEPSTEEPEEPTEPETDEPSSDPTRRDRERDEEQGGDTREKPSRKPERPVESIDPSKSAQPTASRPGVPGNVTAKSGNASATVTWTAAAGNGARVTSYMLSWSGGSRTVSGSTRKATVALSNGTGYTISVRAVNRVGAGPAVSTPRVCPGCAAEAPPNFKVSVISGEEHLFTWDQPELNGGSIVGYQLVRDRGENTKELTRTAETWGGLIDGKEYYFTIQAVTRSPSGGVLIGKTSAITFTVDYDKVGADPRITVSRGATTTYDETCAAPKCAFIQIRVRNLQPGAKYTFVPYTSGWGKFNDGATLEADDDGTLLIDDRFPCSAVGQQVWVTMTDNDDVTSTSSRITWRSG